MQVVERRLEQAAEAVEPRLPAAGRSGTKAGTAENLNSKDNVAGVKAELASDIAELDQKLSGEIAETRKDIHKLQLEMAVLKWMVGATLAGIAAILASVVPILVKLFFAA